VCHEYGSYGGAWFLKLSIFTTSEQFYATQQFIDDSNDEC